MNQTEPMFEHRFDQLARYENGRTPILLTEDQYIRAQACVKACANISTALLQRGGGVFDILANVAKERGDLLAMLISLKESVEFTPLGVRGIKSVEAAIEAIASANGAPACIDHRPIIQHTGDGTAVEFCPECGKNQVVGDVPDGGSS